VALGDDGAFSATLNRSLIRLNARIFYREINDKGQVAGDAGR
jgi:hypothetical protein